MPLDAPLDPLPAEPRPGSEVDLADPPTGDLSAEADDDHPAEADDGRGAGEGARQQLREVIALADLAETGDGQHGDAGGRGRITGGRGLGAGRRDGLGRGMSGGHEGLPGL